MVHSIGLYSLDTILKSQISSFLTEKKDLNISAAIHIVTNFKEFRNFYGIKSVSSSKFDDGSNLKSKLMVSNRFISELTQTSEQKTKPSHNIFSNHFTYFAARIENECETKQDKTTERKKPTPPPPLNAARKKTEGKQQTK